MKKLGLLLLFAIASGLSFAKTDFFRVMFNKNGDHEATIGWNQVSGDSAVLFWGKEDMPPSRYLDYTNLAHVVHANKYKGMENRFARLIDLEPNTAYYFVVKDNEGVSERYWFKTTPHVNTSQLSFIAGGDSRSRRVPRTQGFKMVGKLAPHAILFDGDYTDIDNEVKWKFWFEDYKASYAGFDNRIIPIVTTRGNHEQSNDCLINFFDCPDEKNVYNVTMGGDLVNIICLNTEILFGGAQKKFLEQTLIEHEKFLWQIPMYHRACRPHVNWKMKMKGVKQIYKRWIDLFEKHGVRLAIECDSHITKVTWPIVKGKAKGIEDGFIRDDENGIVYAGEGCWGAPLRVPDRIRSWTRDAGQVNSFKWIFVSNEEIEMRTVDYMNADEIVGLTDETRFDMPKNIKLWAPANGAVVKIKK
ncbi:MAG: hypothetical protein ACI857_002309 [Arenicella sp.]|jgi:hypothetical protein